MQDAEANLPTNDLNIEHCSLSIEHFSIKNIKHSPLKNLQHLALNHQHPRKQKSPSRGFKAMVACRLSYHFCNYIAVGYLAPGTKAHYLQVVLSARHQSIDLASGF